MGGVEGGCGIWKGRGRVIWCFAESQIEFLNWGCCSCEHKPSDGHEQSVISLVSIDMKDQKSPMIGLTLIGSDVSQICMLVLNS